MSRNQRRRRTELGWEPLEGRALLSVAALPPTHTMNAALGAHVKGPEISSNPAGKAAILDAMLGGAGHEFVALALKEVKNPLGVAHGFQNGTLIEYSVPGIVVKTPNLQSGYTGLPHDVLAVTVGGAVVLKKQQIELGAIVRGPYTTTPFASTLVFAINRGAGQRLGPDFDSRPGITPDLLVTVTVGPFGHNNSATITDRTTGSTQPISSSLIRVAGPTVRILLKASQLPSEGFALKHDTFAIWTETQPHAPIEDVGSFIPEDSMIPIGVETNVGPTF